jgi:UTP:GlnB (protein PII) uridylyltransferase
MPRSYRAAYDEETSAEHARVASARRSATARVELVASRPDAPSALCVAADDRAGLLATISAALVLSGIDVIDAEAHTRRTSGGRAEAVDLFWVRRSDPARREVPLTEADVAEVHSVLVGLLEGRVDESTARPHDVAVSPGPSETNVRFVEDDDGALSILEVETDDRSGLLLSLSRALFQQRVQIEQSQVKTNGARVRDRFKIVELNGSPISDERRLQVQVAVLTAVDPTKR